MLYAAVLFRSAEEVYLNAFCSGNNATKHDIQTVDRLVDYIRLVCNDHKLASAEEVAAVFHFDLKEQPCVARKRLRRFV